MPGKRMIPHPRTVSCNDSNLRKYRHNLFPGAAHYLCALFALAACVAAGSSARADPAQDCRVGAAEARVTGCSALLAEARTPRQRAIALDGRCKANNDRLAFATALTDCTSAIRADDDYPYSFANRGIAQAALNNHAAAILDFTQAHTMRPNFIYPLMNRAKSHTQLGNLLLASRDYDEVLRLKPDNEEAKLARAALFAPAIAGASPTGANTLCGSVGCN